MTNEIYHRLVNESPKAFEAFNLYKNLGVERSIDSAWRQYSKSDRVVAGYFRAWAANHNWVGRARAYDEFVNAEAQKKIDREAIQRRAEIIKRHALTGKVLQQRGIKYLEEHGVDKSTDAIAAIKTGVAIERQAESLPEYLMAIVDTPDDELMRQYAELLNSIGMTGAIENDDEPNS